MRHFARSRPRFRAPRTLQIGIQVKPGNTLATFLEEILGFTFAAYAQKVSDVEAPRGAHIGIQFDCATESLPGFRVIEERLERAPEPQPGENVALKKPEGRTVSLHRRGPGFFFIQES